MDAGARLKTGKNLREAPAIGARTSVRFDPVNRNVFDRTWPISVEAE